MSLRELRIHNLRIIKDAALSFSPHLNLIYGDNASGKTTVLEAIYLLATVRSFRSRTLSDYLRYSEKSLTITGTVDADSIQVNLGIRRDGDGIEMRAHGDSVKRVSDLAAWLPVQIIHPDSHQLVAGGPKHRRQFLDWGLFHVDTAFMPYWRRYDQALKQHNASLRQSSRHTSSPGKIIEAWYPELDLASERLNELRQGYILALNQLLPDFTRGITGQDEVSIEYLPGWDTSQPLSVACQQHFIKDRIRGFTHYGPHRCELVCKFNGRPAKAVLSRGQQKMVVNALYLAQAELFTRQTGKECIIMMDDMSAELDNKHRKGLMSVLQKMSVQLFITAVRVGDMDVSTWKNHKVFHVEHGGIAEVL